MVFSVVLFGSIMKTIMAANDARAADERKRQLLRRQLDMNLITSLDCNGDGVDKLEFVLGK